MPKFSLPFKLSPYRVPAGGGAGGARGAVAVACAVGYLQLYVALLSAWLGFRGLASILTHAAARRSFGEPASRPSRRRTCNLTVLYPRAKMIKQTVSTAIQTFQTVQLQRPAAEGQRTCARPFVRRGHDEVPCRPTVFIVGIAEQ